MICPPSMVCSLNSVYSRVGNFAENPSNECKERKIKVRKPKHSLNNRDSQPLIYAVASALANNQPCGQCSFTKIPCEYSPSLRKRKTTSKDRNGPSKAQCVMRELEGSDSIPADWHGKALSLLVRISNQLTVLSATRDGMLAMPTVIASASAAGEQIQTNSPRTSSQSHRPVAMPKAPNTMYPPSKAPRHFWNHCSD